MVGVMSLERPEAPNPYDFVPDAPAELEVNSEDFADGAPLPDSAGAEQGGTRPHLSWSEGPEGTACYLLTCIDPDAPVAGGFRHWAAVVPGSTTTLAAGAQLPEGSVELVNDYGQRGFGGAAPPPGDRPHRYIFTVTALDTAEHGIDADTSFAKAQFLTLGSVLARGQRTGTYQL